MELKTGRVVYSKAGRDKGYFLVITEANENYVLVADGKERPLERPKRKNTKHIGVTKAVLDNGSMSTNRALRRSLFELTNTPEMMQSEEENK